MCITVVEAPAPMHSEFMISLLLPLMPLFIGRLSQMHDLFLSLHLFSNTAVSKRPHGDVSDSPTHAKHPESAKSRYKMCYI